MRMMFFSDCFLYLCLIKSGKAVQATMRKEVACFFNDYKLKQAINVWEFRKIKLY